MGRLLRNITDTAPRANTESYAVKEALAAGEMAPEKSLNQLLDNNIRQLQDKSGIIIDGYPRNLQQVKYFENKVGQLASLLNGIFMVNVNMFMLKLTTILDKFSAILSNSCLLNLSVSLPSS